MSHETKLVTKSMVKVLDRRSKRVCRCWTWSDTYLHIYILKYYILISDNLSIATCSSVFRLLRVPVNLYTRYIRMLALLCFHY